MIFTQLQPSATFYAACGPESAINEINNGGIGGVSQPLLFNGAPAFTTDADFYGCCVSCINNPSCAGYFFLAGAFQGQQNCGQWITSLCNSEGQWGLNYFPDPGANLDEG
jgi:hypothetical protein